MDINGVYASESALNTSLRLFQHNNPVVDTNPEVDTNISPMLQMKKPRHQEVKQMC